MVSRSRRTHQSSIRNWLKMPNACVQFFSLSLLALGLACLSLPVSAQQQQRYGGNYSGNNYGGNYAGNTYGGGNYVGNPLNYNLTPTNGASAQAAGGYYGGYSGYPRTNGSASPTYGQYPYANQPGYGYYAASPYGNSFPALGAPVPVNGGMFRFNVGGFSGSYWKSPSGYYYPWGAGAVYANPAPVIIVNQQGSSEVAQPTVTAMLTDMSSYIEDQNTKKKFKQDDYMHLSRRVRDLQNLESTMRTRNSGVLESNDEEKLRKDCAMLSGDISRRIIP